MIIQIRKGLLLEGPDATVLGTGLADEIARANGIAYAETFAKTYNGKTLELDNNLRIKPEIQ